MEILSLEYVKNRMIGSVPQKQDTDGSNYDDDEKIEESIREAESLVLSYCRMVGIDISDITPTTAIELRVHALNILIYSINDIPSESSRYKYEKSIEYLNDVAEGRAVLKTKISKKSGIRSFRVNWG